MSEHVSALLVAPLENLASDIEEAEIEQGLSIRRILGLEFEHLWETYHLLPDYAEMVAPLQQSTHALYLHLHGTVNELRADLSLQRRLDEFTIALRLYGANHVGINCSWVRQLDPETHDISWFRNRPVKELFFPPRYRLTFEDVAPLTEVLARFRSASRSTTYDLALRRFNSLYARLDPEDKLIDCWVGLEALYAPDGRHGDLKYRAAMRIARVLGPSAEERLRLFRRMKKSYDARSAVAHGRGHAQELTELVEETENVLRTTLARALDQDWPNSIGTMDKQLLS